MPSPRRLGALAASAALVVAASAVPAGAVPSNNPVGIDAGRDWLAGQLTGGMIENSGTPDYPATLEVALALRGIEVWPEFHQVADALSTRVTAATTYHNTRPASSVHTSANRLAQLGVIAQEAGDATSYGGHDLVAGVSARISTAAPVAGRLVDGGIGQGASDGDLANVLGQAYAVRLLVAADDPQAGPARSFLLAQQCPGGGFRQAFTADRTSPDQGCTDDAEARLDATSIVVTQLSAVPGGPTTTAALTSARSWLADRQHLDGSWGGDAGAPAENSVSTGFATQALGTAGSAYDDEVAAGATWLRARQASYYDVCDHLLADRGAIAYTDESLAYGRAHGLVPVALGTRFHRQWLLTTARAVTALQYLPQDWTPTDPEMTAPEQAVWKAGTQVTMHVTGVHAGDLLCLNSSAGLLRQFTATDETDDQVVTLANVTGEQVYTVRDDYGHNSIVRLQVLGSKTLTVTASPSTVRRGATVTAAVRGLQPGEPARIFYGYDLVRSGPASALGNFVARFPAGTVLGRHYVRGYGQFGDIRKGYTSVTVVR